MTNLIIRLLQNVLLQVGEMGGLRENEGERGESEKGGDREFNYDFRKQTLIMESLESMRFLCVSFFFLFLRVSRKLN